MRSRSAGALLGCSPLNPDCTTQSIEPLILREELFPLTQLGLFGSLIKQPKSAPAELVGSALLAVLQGVFCSPFKYTI